MFMRCAFFRGSVKPGREAEFTAYIDEKLVPMWKQFPGAVEVRVLRQVECDLDDPRYELVLAIRYPSREAMDRALASNVREKSHGVTDGLMEMFDGTLFHMVFNESFATAG